MFTSLLIAGLVLAGALLVIGGWLWIAANMKEAPQYDPRVSRTYAEKLQEERGICGWADTGEEQFRRERR